MSAKFKLILLTSMVTVSESYVPGDEIEVGNDEAWQLLNEGLAEPKKKNQKAPQKPQRVLEAEARAETEKQRQAEIQLPCIHPEGKELNEALVKLAARDKESKQQADEIAQLEAKLTAAEEQNSQLSEQLAGRHQQILEMTDLTEQLESKVAALEEVLSELDDQDEAGVQPQQPQFLEDPAPENAQ
ncbi:hypothetical protein [uncultured Microbulbifer sp.]|uniref:hypothetical protein n=1 Tax=uncultured Microbulbifer sp. TaxID=348147 RepID=UPI002636C407|nr:hypothetical protein [uncultured Microbulbifer sp.]